MWVGGGDTMRRAMPSEPAFVTIHILEDDPGVRDSLRILLQSHGYRAAAYYDAESFLQAPPPHAADTVIVDLNLPGIGGLAVIRWLLSMKAQPRVIAITGEPQAMIDAQLKGLRPPVLLRKPLSEAVITAHL